ncbi:MAG: DUF3488 and DUF4129 domain-containing transglutaminase family protein [Haloquadratum sp.]
MSAAAWVPWSADHLRRLDGPRVLAVVGLLALTWAYASVLWHVTTVVGKSAAFVVVVAAAAAAAALLGRYLSVRAAAGVTLGLLGAGLAAYLAVLPDSQLQLLTAERVLSDTVALLTGLSILRLVSAGVWAIGVVVGPVFLSWYLAVRERYAGAAATGCVALALVVLTGDAGGATTLVGVVGATAAAASSTFARHGAGLAQVDVLTVLIAAMVVATATLSVVPGASGSPVVPNRGTPTVEANLIDVDDRVEIAGSIRLSPTRRFTVESPRREYWQTGVYDRYTGSGWIRTGSVRPFDGRIAGPPGDARTLQQTVTARDEVSILPAAWKPVDVEGAVASRTLVTPQGSIRPVGTLEPGETYTVTSRVPRATPQRLRDAGTDYPAAITETYLQLPDSTTDRVRRRAETVAGDEATPYAKARAIETYLESTKEYSLTVPKPTGGVADAFLFEMDAGYCTYYATTMVVMLRAQGVPARFVTGYTPGERVGGDRYVVRGLNAHAWVQVYFPDVGWVRFDPTPAGPRRTAEAARLAEARRGNESGPLDGSNDTATPAPTPPSEENTATATPAPNGSLSGDDVPDVPSGPVIDSGRPSLPDLPSKRTLLVGAVALVGLVAGAHRIGATSRARRLLAIQFQRRRGEPTAEVVCAYRRLALLLALSHRPRRPGETARAHLRSARAAGGLPDSVEARLDDAERVVDLYERARYGNGVTPADADEAVSTVDRLVRSSTPVVRRLRRADRIPDTV